MARTWLQIRVDLHVFELADGRQVGFPDDSFDLGMGWLDHAEMKVARELKPGQVFTYVFDLGDDWHHRCTILQDKVDPVAEYGMPPPVPAAIWGWGTIPDQYGRRSFDEVE